MKSFIPISASCDFSMQNIPFGVFHRESESPSLARPCTALGDFVIDLKHLENNGKFTGPLFSKLAQDNKKVFQGNVLNNFMELTRPHWQEVRATIQQLFS